jgi:hypothetical protein
MGILHVFIFPASHQIPSLLWNPKVHYYVQKSLTMHPVLGSYNKSTLYFLKIQLNIIFSPTPRFLNTSKLISN